MLFISASNSSLHLSQPRAYRPNAQSWNTYKCKTPGAAQYWRHVLFHSPCFGRGYGFRVGNVNAQAFGDSVAPAHAHSASSPHLRLPLTPQTVRIQALNTAYQVEICSHNPGRARAGKVCLVLPLSLCFACATPLDPTLQAVLKLPNLQTFQTIWPYVNRSKREW